MRNKPRGFTLLELLIGLAVGAILLGLAVPTFTAVIRQNRLANQTNQFMLTLALARSEAVKRGARISICAASSPVAQTGCGAATDWDNGWLLFTDAEGAPGVLDVNGAPDDTILQVWSAPSNQAMDVASARAALTYSSDGRADVATTFTISPHICTGNDARTINVNLSGRASKAAIACP